MIAMLSLIPFAFADEPDCRQPCDLETQDPNEFTLGDAIEAVDDVDRRLDSLKRQLASTPRWDEDRIKELEERVDKLEEEIALLKERVTALEERVAGNTEQIRWILERLNGLEGRVSELEDRVDAIEPLVYQTADRMWYGGGFAAIGVDVHPLIGTVVPTPVSFIAGGGGIIGGEGQMSGSVLECGAFAYLPNGYGGDCQLAHYWKGERGKTAHGFVYGVSGHAYAVGQAGAASFEHLGSFAGGQIGSYHRFTLTQGRGGALDLVVEPRVRIGRAGTYNGDPGGVVGFIPIVKIQYRKFWEDKNPEQPVE